MELHDTTTHAGTHKYIRKIFIMSHSQLIGCLVLVIPNLARLDEIWVDKNFRYAHLNNEIIGGKPL